MNRRRSFIIGFVASLFAGAALASWYDDYDAGVNAVRKGQWQVVVQKMSAALNGNGRENDKTRTYGAIFINYHPYYYRGVAYLNLGKYEQAISDFEKTSGPGEENLGSIETLMQRAKSKLESTSNPPPEPQPQPVPQPRPVPVPRVEPEPPQPRPQPLPQPRPTPVPPPLPAPQPFPAGPSLDTGLQKRVALAIRSANSSLATARARKAGSSAQYAQAVQALADANTRMNTARSNDDLNAALAAAQNAGMFADSAQAAAQKPSDASNLVMAETTRRVRTALTSYFAGDFDDATRQFKALAERELPDNAWIWAFLGASQYSQYAFEADENYKTAALRSFQKAKGSGKFRSGLPEKYFSKRIRRVFATVALQ